MQYVPHPDRATRKIDADAAEIARLPERPNIYYVAPRGFRGEDETCVYCGSDGGQIRIEFSKDHPLVCKECKDKLAARCTELEALEATA